MENRGQPSALTVMQTVFEHKVYDQETLLRDAFRNLKEHGNTKETRELIFAFCQTAKAIGKDRILRIAEETAGNAVSGYILYVQFACVIKSIIENLRKATD